ncbi:MAG: type II toxin-antitoxin system VapC family toxin [Saccharopolyspora sp.]|uniref:type II toxin-antitoxin system VapC family toxin n=1 Tax=Saccharopolyspora TaxID=1835 RepID=UPI00190AFB66|nr:MULTISPECIES: type II toxin-antitoxin system VapC family toxin [unclassified Saccharopolyspora]MBK0865861.1 type II toxin-antitoxin system VapC family toxin [Saccharopolyspora sp. HNM0986]MBQ6642734.1 type II toxin-antitoxin system VapC family toxin [Saccharopolyspora sp.]
MIYFDSCAFLKLLLPEEHRPAIAKYVSSNQQPWVSSELLLVEVLRVLNRGVPSESSWRWATKMLAGVVKVPVSEIATRAYQVTPASIRSLDAIHLATALHVGTPLSAFITYDKRLEEAAVAHQLPVVVPKDE